MDVFIAGYIGISEIKLKYYCFLHGRKLPSFIGDPSGVILAIAINHLRIFL